jgi:molecular chaperone GrpE
MAASKHDPSVAPPTVSSDPDAGDSAGTGPAEDAAQLSSSEPLPPDTGADDGTPSGEPSDAASLAEAGGAAVDELTPEEDAAAEAFLAELQEKAAKADEYLALAQRTQADFENYRKRTLREASAAKERGVRWLARELLPAIDALDRALAAAKDGHIAADDPLVSGVKLVHTEVLAGLARAGVKPFSPEGEPFDPTVHEAVSQLPAVDGAEPGTVVEVYARGYKLGDTVLRPARVVVAG